MVSKQTNPSVNVCLQHNYMFSKNLWQHDVMYFLSTHLPGLPDKVLAILPDSYHSSAGMMGSTPRGGFSISTMLNGRESPSRHRQPLPASMAHDAVMVLDPSPGENFGHPVVLFYVDLNVTKKRCSYLDGIYLGESVCRLSRCTFNSYI